MYHKYNEPTFAKWKWQPLVDLVHLSLDAILVAASLVLTIYCFKLFSKFLKGGIFEASIKTLLAAGLLLLSGTLFDIMAETLEFSVNLHYFHISLDIVSVILIVYGVRQLHQAWTSLS